jgi:hypothetical protein
MRKGISKATLKKKMGHRRLPKRGGSSFPELTGIRFDSAQER